MQILINALDKHIANRLLNAQQNTDFLKRPKDVHLVMEGLASAAKIY
jgi:hypothetical protein